MAWVYVVGEEGWYGWLGPGRSRWHICGDGALDINGRGRSLVGKKGARDHSVAASQRHPQTRWGRTDGIERLSQSRSDSSHQLRLLLSARFLSDSWEETRQVLCVALSHCIHAGMEYDEDKGIKDCGTGAPAGIRGSESGHLLRDVERVGERTSAHQVHEASVRQSISGASVGWRSIMKTQQAYRTTQADPRFWLHPSNIVLAL